MSQDETQYFRTIYTALDFLGDVGGLVDALRYIAYLFIWVLQADGLLHYILSKMYRFRVFAQNIHEDQLVERH